MRIWIAVSLLASMYATAGTWYVSPDGDGAGTSWDQPSDLQNALVGAVAGDEIWLRMGTYRPGVERDSSFVLPADVVLRGGFAGHEDAASERVAGNKSTLSGDIQQADVATDNCFHVLRSSGPGNYTLDALEVCDGQAEAPAPVTNGAGFLGEDGIALTITDCLFRDHSAAGDGGHIWLGDECALVIVDTRLEGGGAGQDGGAFRAGNWGRIAHDVQADITLQNVEIANIQAAGDGGAFRAGNWGHVVATGLTIEGATAGGSGGAFRAGNWGRVTGSDWQISDTTAATDGGLAAFDEDAFIDLQNSTITNATAIEGNGGVFRAGNWGRTAHVETPDVSMQNVVVRSSQAGGDGGLFRAGNWGHVVATGLTIEGAAAGGSGGAFRAGNWGRVTGSNWLTSDTTAATDGGLAAFDEDAFIDLQNSTITNATAIAGNGGVFRAGNWGRTAHVETPDVSMQNVVVRSSQAGGDGGLFRAGNWGHVVATDLVIETATAGGSGGAFRAGNWGRITGSGWQTSDTTAATNGGLVAFDDDAFLDLGSSVITNPRATAGNGGAFRAGNLAECPLSACSMAERTASYCSGSGKVVVARVHLASLWSFP